MYHRMVRGQKSLEQIENQAIREGGQLLILSPENGLAAGLSTLPQDKVSIKKSKNSLCAGGFIKKVRSALPRQNTGTQLVGSIGIHGFIGGTPDIYMMGKIHFVTKFIDKTCHNSFPFTSY